MANLLYLMNKATIIDTKAGQIVQDTIADYNHGNVTTKTDLLYRLLSKLKLFYESANKPLIKRRYARGLPDRFEFNDTINEAVADMKAMAIESDNILDIINQSYTQVEFDRTRIQNSMRLIESLYKKAGQLINDLESNDIFIEEFANLDIFDESACEDEQVYINTAFGYITLALVDSLNINENISCLEILDGSNGFPGNTHQADSIDNEVRFVGEDGIQSDIGAVIDNNADTWLEYELFKVSQDVYISTLGMGFNYQEGISWITNSDELRLSLKITFNDLEEMNVLSLSPFIPSDKDALPASITNITISDGRGRVQRLVEGFIERFNRERVYLFPRQKVKTIILEFIQPYAYATKIGHLYYQEITTDNINYFTQHELKSNKRVNEELPSSSAVGLVYDDEKQLYVQPKTGGAIHDVPVDKQELFSVPDGIDPNIRGGFEILPAYRFQISIKEITCENNRYNGLAEYVSIEYKTQTPVNSIRLEAEEEIPGIFQESETDKDWVRYNISVDNGENWYPIIPRGLYKRGGAEKYLVNSMTPQEMHSDNIGYIETGSEVNSVRVKIQLERPADIPDAEAFSPVVYNYTLQTI